jgi:hypothetical protein
MTEEKKARSVAVDIGFPNDTSITVYASPKIGEALKLIGQMDTFHGVKILQLIQVVYRQGKRDGAREAFTKLERHIEALKEDVPHRKPGRQPKHLA